MDDPTIVSEFITCIHILINYWDNQTDGSSKEKMEGLAHSMLCMLDGVSDCFIGNIDVLAKECENTMLHDHLYDHLRNPTKNGA
jgi:hypothetical protein